MSALTLIEKLQNPSRTLAERNMSYCRFENTAGDLEDCLMAFEDPEDHMSEMSREETAAVSRLVQACVTIGEKYGKLADRRNVPAFIETGELSRDAEYEEPRIEPDWAK